MLLGRKRQTYELPISITGLAPLTHIEFDHKDAKILQTLYTQKNDDSLRGHLAGSSSYTTYAYDSDVLENFRLAVDSTFEVLRQAIDSKQPRKYLMSEVKHSGFQRLT